MDEIDRILSKYRTDRRLSNIFLSPEFGGKRPHEILVATFLKQQELQEFMVEIKRAVSILMERQNILIQSTGESLARLEKRIEKLERTIG